MVSLKAISKAMSSVTSDQTFHRLDSTYKTIKRVMGDQHPHLFRRATTLQAEIRCGRETVTVEMALEGKLLLSFFRPQNRLAKRLTLAREEFEYLIKTLQEFQKVS